MRCDEGKKSFQTHAAATKAVIRWSWGATYGSRGRRSGIAARTPIRVYACPHCSAYHYTSHREASRGRGAVVQVWGGGAAPPPKAIETIEGALGRLAEERRTDG